MLFLARLPVPPVVVRAAGRRRTGTLAVLLACCCLGWPADSRGQAASPAATAQDALLERIWAGVQQAQQHSTACGSLTETRTSRLLTRPLVLRGTFCVQGTTAFRVSYTEPEEMSIVYRDKYVNVIRRKERSTEAFDAGAGVARAMAYFGAGASTERLRRDFRATAGQVKGSYVLRLEPAAGRFKDRTGPIVATFDERDFRITKLEINGRNGVRSVFDIRIERLDVPLDPAEFDMYHPKHRLERLP
jgi:outer membrane lipoprotein-sorting protein